MFEIKMNDMGLYDVYKNGKVIFSNLTTREDALDMVEDHVNGILYEEVDGEYRRIREMN